MGLVVAMVALVEVYRRRGGGQVSGGAAADDRVVADEFTTY